MTALPQPKSSNKLRAIAEAVERTEIGATRAWQELDALSTKTEIDAIEVYPEGIILNADENFEGILNIYVLLTYGQGDESFQTTDAFRGHFRGHFDGGRPIIDDVTVDTSPFYEGEEAAP